MKQGVTKKLKPGPKQKTQTWKKRNEARKALQEAHATAVEFIRQAAQDSQPDDIIAFSPVEGITYVREGE